VCIRFILLFCRVLAISQVTPCREEHSCIDCLAYLSCICPRTTIRWKITRRSSQCSPAVYLFWVPPNWSCLISRYCTTVTRMFALFWRLLNPQPTEPVPSPDYILALSVINIAVDSLHCPPILLLRSDSWYYLKKTDVSCFIGRFVSVYQGMPRNWSHILPT